MKLATIAILLIAAACGTDKKHKDNPPAIVETQVSAVAVPVAPIPPAAEPQPANTPDPPVLEPEPAAPQAPAFDKDKYLAGQEAAMLEFVGKLKTIKVYDVPSDFLKPTLEQSKVGVHYGSPFTSAEPDYRGYISQPPTNPTGCANIQGSTHHQIATL